MKPHNIQKIKHRIKAIQPNMLRWLSGSCGKGYQYRRQNVIIKTKHKAKASLPKVTCKLKINYRNFYKQILGNYFHKVEKTKKILKVYPT